STWEPWVTVGGGAYLQQPSAQQAWPVLEGWAQDAAAFAGALALVLASAGKQQEGSQPISMQHWMHSQQQPSSSQQARHSGQQSPSVQHGWSADATGWSGSARIVAGAFMKPAASATAATVRTAPRAELAKNLKRMIVLQNLVVLKRMNGVVGRRWRLGCPHRLTQPNAVEDVEGGRRSTDSLIGAERQTWLNPDGPVRRDEVRRRTVSLDADRRG